MNNTGEEIEAKYLIFEDGKDYSTSELRKMYQSVGFLEFDIFKHGAIINQGYLPLDIGMHIAKIINMNVNFDPAIARLRSKSYFSNTPKEFYFTLKGEGQAKRRELEQLIDRDLYIKYWKETEGRRIKKVRYEKTYNNRKIEFDTYIDDRPELIIAEIEVPTLKDMKKLIPLGKDVTFDSKYKNSSLAK